MEENESKMVTIHVMGKKHEVPADLTIMKAMEYSGHQFRRGAGCRGGYCGACAAMYRVKGSYKLQGALACQKIVEDGMYIAQIPFSPAEKITYDLSELRPDANTFLDVLGAGLGACVAAEAPRYLGVVLEEGVGVGEFDADIDELKRLDRKTLQERYEGREVKL